MSAAIDDGGAAFPTRPENLGYNGSEGTGACGGMTLRDWFAGQALAGLVFHNDYGTVSDENIAKGAYQYADAMLAARKQ